MKIPNTFVTIKKSDGDSDTFKGTLIYNDTEICLKEPMGLKKNPATNAIISSVETVVNNPLETLYAGVLVAAKAITGARARLGDDDEVRWLIDDFKNNFDTNQETIFAAETYLKIELKDICYLNSLNGIIILKTNNKNLYSIMIVEIAAKKLFLRHLKRHCS